MSHPNIDTRKISCPPRARPGPGHQAWPWGPQRRPACRARGACVPYSSPHPTHPAAGQRGPGTSSRAPTSIPDHCRLPGGRQQQKPERVGDFLETSWNCSTQREKQPASPGILCVRGRGSKKPLIVFKLNRFTANRMLSRERGKRLRGQLRDTAEGGPPPDPFCLLDRRDRK